MIVRPESDVNSQRQGPSRVRTIRPLHALWLSKLTQGLSQGNMQPALSQDSDDLYGPLELDSAMAWELAEMEGLHGPPLELGRGEGQGGLVRSSTLANLPRVSNEEWSELNARGVLQRSASQPEGTSAQRAAEAQRVKKQRLDRTKKLNKYVPVLKDKCLVHLLDRVEIFPDHFPAPCSDLDAVGERYQTFRKRFRFKRFMYCFTCGLPQGRSRNGEGPECHEAYQPGGAKCPFQYVIFKTAFIAGHKKDMLASMRGELGVPGNTVEEYMDWVTSEEEVPGRYHNAIEAFLWCCERLERTNPRLFL